MDTERIRSAFLGSKRRIAGSVGGGLVVLVVFAVLLGVIGVPGVGAVENRFGTVNDSTTVIETDLVVTNPNPVGVSLSGTTVDYTVKMNDVSMASGQKAGLAIESGNSTLPFRTYMQNDRIPPWWHSHIENRERTEVVIDAVVRSGLLGGRQISLPQNRTIETDLLGQFNSSETRPIEADRPFPSDPILFVNETSARWDRADLSRERTPIAMSFRAYNPKQYPYAVSELGYTITMNDVQVGEGSSEDVATILPRTTQRIRADVAIRNQNLDDWWVTHLRNGQVTDLEIQFYAVVDPADDALEGGLGDTGSFRIPLDPLDYRTTIETDMFGTKTESASGSADTGSDDGGQSTPTDSADRSADGGSSETTAEDGSTTETADGTDGDTGGSVTTTTDDDGGLLG
ncbi:LEA type 2 family protein [Halorientalis regularis]|uniref:LEA14-like dessication related protein n=1 Tax=Halorientalis regularis TaxID=660518 RepID=A0A1G7Q863_9EURY|nr:LEA type 2 family protein [Halorientalis regularis]SDF94706.1 LEA14-like dessication related protein [Halorientalis regularis]